MCEKLVLSLFLLLMAHTFASVNPPDHECFVDRAQILVEEFDGLAVQECKNISTNSSSEPDDGCNSSRDPTFTLGSEKEKFELSIGVGRHNLKEIIVLKVTISNITFHKLGIKHQNLASGNGEVYWQTIEFKQDEIPKTLSVFSSVWESHRTKIQFFAEGKEYKFFKEYHFIPYSTLDNNEDSQIFAYVDTTFRDKVYLHVQPHINITEYIMQFQPANQKMETSCGPHAVNISVDNLPYRETNFADNANYKFCLIPVDNNGTTHTAISVATFCMQKSYESLLIVILGVGAIPVFIFFILYIVYILFRKKVLKWLKGKKPGCLLVYSATHDAHIDVMIQLAEYLNECEIDVMIDVLDIPYEAHKNPSHWFDSAFQKANTVVVVASPECKNAIVVKTIYRSLDTHAMKLIHENRRHQNKRYLVLQLPYCKVSDVPKEASAFRLLKIPKDLKILINKIHHTKYTEVYKTPDERKLIESIHMAKKIILNDVSISKPKSFEELTDPILSNINETAIVVDQNEESNEEITVMYNETEANKTEHATDIRDLDLLRDGEA